jgi:predicted nuclease of predicted toxin-antitoxin system
VPKYLLDANLSPKIGRYLAKRFGIDILSLLTMDRGEIGDQEVLRLARSMGRVLITMDADFSSIHSFRRGTRQGIIYLDLPNARRYISDIQTVLGEFFEFHADSIDPDQTLVTIYEDRFKVLLE